MGFVTLHTKGARIEQMEMGWAEKIIGSLEQSEYRPHSFFNSALSV